MVYQGEPSGDTSSDDSDASSGSESGSDEEGSDSEDGSSSASTSDEEFEDVDDDEEEGAGDGDGGGEANPESGAPLEAITEETKRRFCGRRREDPRPRQCRQRRMRDLIAWTLLLRLRRKSHPH